MWQSVKRRRDAKRRGLVMPRKATLARIGVVSFAILASISCGWKPSRPFERDAPAVKKAIAALDAGNARAAAEALQEYLSTGPCKDGNIGTPQRLRQLPNGTFDLGLSHFKLAEKYGGRFGDEEGDAGDETLRAKRGAEVDCALHVLALIATDEGHDIALRAHARYVEGNLNFLDSHYEEAVKAYDAALTLLPAEIDGGDSVAQDIAWNRAIALRRIEDKKNNDAGSDAGEPPSDGGKPDDSQNDGGKKAPSDGGDNKPNPDGGNDEDTPDAAPPPPEPNDASTEAPPPPPRANQDERMLDQLESAPTLQQEAAKKQAQKRRVRGMADK